MRDGDAGREKDAGLLGANRTSRNDSHGHGWDRTSMFLMKAVVNGGGVYVARYINSARAERPPWSAEPIRPLSIHHMDAGLDAKTPITLRRPYHDLMIMSGE